MTQDLEIPGADDPETEPHSAEPVRTGIDSVDTVITAVEALEERPIEEHVGVFESAHDQLRRVLDSRPGPTDEQAPGQTRPS